MFRPLIIVSTLHSHPHPKSWRLEPHTLYPSAEDSPEECSRFPMPLQEHSPQHLAQHLLQVETAPPVLRWKPYYWESGKNRALKSK